MADWREPLLAWIAARLPGAESVRFLRFSGMPAGASNDTLGVDLGVTADGIEHSLPLVFRPQRTGGILAPYDVERQFRVMRALARTEVPVPSVHWFEPTGEVIGVPFYFMGRIQGDTLPLFWYGGRTPRLESAAAALASIHAVDWRVAGLDFLLPDGAAGRASPVSAELALWRVRAERAGLSSHPRISALYDWLEANEPSDARFALLHGDPNPGNYLCRGNRIAAVLDWELAAIGDPRSDLGFYAALTSIFGGMSGPGGRSVLSDAYEAVTGCTLTNLEYYEALGLAKMSVVMAGWGGFGGWGYGAEAILHRLDQLLGQRWADGGRAEVRGPRSE